MNQLYPHQERGVAWLAANPRCGLFDDPGLGKTIQVIRALDTIKAVRVLIVAPTVVIHNWQREVRKWSPSRGVQCIIAGNEIVDSKRSVCVVTHGLLLRPKLLAQLMAEDWDAIVLDEAHFMRSPTAKRTEIFFLGADALCRKAPVCWVLTGTPMPNNPTEMWAMIAGLAPERLRCGDKLLSWAKFRDRFCVTKDTSYGVRVIGAQNLDELRSRISGFAMRRMKAEVLDLPPIRYGTTVLTAENTYPGLDVLEPDHVGVADDLETIRQTAAFSTWRRLCGMAKVKPTFELLDDEMANTDEKYVLFVHHIDVLVELRSLLHEYGVVSLQGSQSAQQRAEAVEKFQADARVRVCIAQIVAGGTGVTLTAANNVVFVEQSFVPGENAQAADRCHRIGQTRPVLVRFLSLAGSVDEIVTDILTTKTKMIREILS